MLSEPILVIARIVEAFYTLGCIRVSLGEYDFADISPPAVAR